MQGPMKTSNGGLFADAATRLNFDVLHTSTFYHPALLLRIYEPAPVQKLRRNQDIEGLSSGVKLQD